MTRYDQNKNIRVRFDGKRYFGTRLYPNIDHRESDIIYITDETDFLDSLALKFYNDTSMWWIIALANNLGKGRLSIPPGTQLRIPVDINIILQKYNKLNN
jgi:hypothetical protein